MKTQLYTLSAAAIFFAAMTACGSDTNQAEARVDEEPAPQTTEAVTTIADVIPQRAEWMPDSVQMLPSGLGIVIENPGNDKRAEAQTPVTLNYRGTLPDGTVFDSSYDRGVPATFSANQVIPGFGEGIRMIGEGGKATLYIPSALGYGPRGAGGIIGPDQNLIFDIEIISINS